MISIMEPSQCCGCTACYAACPKKAISMKMDNEGFLYPIINSIKCVDCGLCEKVCPKVNPAYRRHDDVSVQYGVQINDEKERHESTAGGAFTIIAEYVLGKGGIVYAAGWDNKIVTHKGVEHLNELGELRGSKYVQSDLRDSFSEILNALKREMWVLFTGTPCQVNGLYNFINKKVSLDKLVLVDLLCLGVSSPGVMAKWIKALEEKYGSCVDHIEFRNKKYGYSTTNVRVLFLNGKHIEQRYDSKVYSQTFFKGYNVRPSCYSCDFREIPRISDFTIGDCIDIGTISADFDDDKGTTRMWVHTEKAKKIMCEMREYYRCVSLADNESHIIGGPRKQISHPNRRDKFFVTYQNDSWDALAKEYVPNNMKTIIASFIRIAAYRLMPFKIRKKLFQGIRKYKATLFKKQVRQANNE